MPEQHGPEDHEPSRSRRALQASRSHVQPGSFLLLLVAALLAYVLNGLAVDSMATTVLVQSARAAVGGACLYVLSWHRGTLWLGVLVIGLQVTFEAQLWGLDASVNRVLQDVTTMVFLFSVLVVVLREVFRPTTMEPEAVVGALCGFLLVLMGFTRLHALLEVLHPGSYQGSGAPLSAYSETTQVAIFQYFSTVTLTTVGFGDIVPVTPVTRIATGLEAITGQLYLAVVIATLVGRVAGRPR